MDAVAMDAGSNRTILFLAEALNSFSSIKSYEK